MALVLQSRCNCIACLGSPRSSLHLHVQCTDKAAQPAPAQQQLLSCNGRALPLPFPRVLRNGELNARSENGSPSLQFPEIWKLPNIQNSEDSHLFQKPELWDARGRWPRGDLEPRLFA
ncbi:hypothetical protein ACLOJK_005073 [Asimina triloba]